MSGDLEIREFVDADQPAIEDLFGRVAGRPFPPRRFRWLFIENALGRGVCPVALLGKTLVGSTASIAIPFRMGDSRLDIFRLQDALVDESCRGQGIYTRLMVESSRIFDERGVPFVFGFPNENSRRLFLGKGGYSLVDEIPTLGLAVSRLDGQPVPGLEFRAAGPDTFGAGDEALFDELWESVPLHTLRTREYLNLRYSPAVGHDYAVVRGFDGPRLRALAVGKFYAPAASIDLVELACPADPGILAATLQALARALGEGRARGFQTWIGPANPLAGAAAAVGFLPADRTTNLIWRNNPARGMAAPAAEELLITMGDSDVY